MEATDDKKKRRSKTDSKGRDYLCECGKKYLSYQALYTHKKTKHPDVDFPKNSSNSKPSYSKLPKSVKFEEGQLEVTHSQVPFENNSKWTKRGSKGTCDDVFREYLQKMRKKVDDGQFATLKCSMTALRECINKNSHKVDQNYFLSDDLFTVTEKPALIPNICNFFVLEYLPNEYPNHVKTDEIHFILEFCKWLYKKKYTVLGITMNL
jgi:hypothetical protein